MSFISFVLFGFVLVLTEHFVACNVVSKTVSDELEKRTVNVGIPKGGLTVNIGHGMRDLIINGNGVGIQGKVPSWFSAYTKLCYQWYPDGDGGQCGAGEPRRLCTHINSATQYYRDDTDNRGGGCRMSWSIESPHSPQWFKNVQICYRWYPDGDGGQCGGGAARLLCAPVGKYTAVYRDDTDNRGGGCRMSWQLKLPPVHSSWARNIQLCYEWYPDGDGGQCGGGAARKLCALANFWTPYYRDDTDNRGGGCRMRWGLYYK